MHRFITFALAVTLSVQIACLDNAKADTSDNFFDELKSDVFSTFELDTGTHTQSYGPNSGQSKGFVSWMMGFYNKAYSMVFGKEIKDVDSLPSFKELTGMTLEEFILSEYADVPEDVAAKFVLEWCEEYDKYIAPSVRKSIPPEVYSKLKNIDCVKVGNLLLVETTRIKKELAQEFVRVMQ